MGYFNNIRNLVHHNKVIFENFSYLTLFQVLSILFPLITYPYLTRVLGLELYGTVITAQVLASYCTILVNFGFPAISPRHVSINKDNREKLSVIFSSIFTIQLLLWVVSFMLYMLIISIVPAFHEHYFLFFLSFFLTLQPLLFPSYYFQGVEKMKYITIINVVFNTVFVLLTFVVVRKPEDYIYVPLLHSIGYLFGGIIALYVILRVHCINFQIPKKTDLIYYFKDALPIFSTDVICTIKNKLNYLLLGNMVGMSSVVIYDVGEKLNMLLQKPVATIKDAIFPKMARDRSDAQFIKMGKYIVLILVLMFIVTNIFLHQIVYFLIGTEVDLFPVRIYLLAPLFVGTSSYIAQCLLAARGYNKYLLYSIIFTTVAYVMTLLIMLIMGNLNTVTSFVYLAVLSYFAELVYRIYIARKVFDKKI